MSAVLWVLAGATIVLGFFQESLLTFLEKAPGAGQSLPIGHHGWLPVAASISAVAAIALAWWEFGRKSALRRGFVERMPSVAALFANRWYLDHLYRYLLDKLIYQGLSRLFAWNDKRIIDGVVDGLGTLAVGLGAMIARLHTGMIQYRLTIMFGVIALLICYLGFGG